MALSLLLLIGAGLFLRTLRNATSGALGYDVDRVLVADLNLDVRGYTAAAGQVAYAAILEGVNALPGVIDAGAVRVTVLSGAARMMNVGIDGQRVADDNRNALNIRANVIHLCSRVRDAVTRRWAGLPAARAAGHADRPDHRAPGHVLAGRSCY